MNWILSTPHSLPRYESEHISYIIHQNISEKLNIMHLKHIWLLGLAFLLSACTEMLWMCERYVGFWFKVRPITFGCVALGSAVLFILRSRLLIYSAGSAVNRVQVVLSGFSVRLLCFIQAQTLCRYGCIFLLYSSLCPYMWWWCHLHRP